MSRLERVRASYTTVVDKSAEYGLELGDVDDKVIDRVFGVVKGGLDEVQGSVDRGLVGARNVAEGADTAKTELEGSVANYENSADWISLLSTLPELVRQTQRDLMLGVQKPELLAPALACCGAPSLEEDTEKTNRDVEQLVPEDVSAKDPQHARWIDMVKEFISTASELHDVCEILHAVMRIIESIKESSLPVLEKISSIFQEIFGTQESSARSLNDVTGYVQDGSAGIKSRSLDSSTPRAMPTVEALFDKLKTARDSGMEASEKAVRVTEARSTWTSFFSDIKLIIEKLMTTDWSKVVEILKKVARMFPDVLRIAKEIMYPVFPMSLVFTPSALAARIDGRFEELMNICDLNAVADAIRSAADRLLKALGLTTEGTEDHPMSSLQKDLEVVEESSREVAAKIGDEQFWDQLEDECVDEIHGVLKETAKDNAKDMASDAVSAFSSALGDLF